LGRSFIGMERRSQPDTDDNRDVFSDSSYIDRLLRPRVRPVGRKGHSGNELVVYGFGFIFALIGAALGFVVALKFRRWFSALGLGVSAWMLFWFGLMMSAAD
jgi:hypothetical protein